MHVNGTCLECVCKRRDQLMHVHIKACLQRPALKVHHQRKVMPQQPTISNRNGLVACRLGDTAVQVFNMQRAQMTSDTVRACVSRFWACTSHTYHAPALLQIDSRSLAGHLADEADAAGVPTVPPLTTCVGLPAEVTCCVLVDYDLVAACQNYAARWNVKV